MNRNQSKISCKRGFTLIELLVVVLIIGILAAVALPQYQKAVYKSRYATLKHLAESVAKAEEVYYLANNVYTTKFSDLDIDVGENGTLNQSQDRYTYDWGVCAIGGSNEAVACKNEKSHLTYQKYFAYASVSRLANKRNCIAAVTDDVANEVCKSETNRSIPDSTTNTTNSYSYLE